MKILPHRPDPDTGDDVWEDVSAEAKDLIKKLLTVDPGKRLSSIGAIKHPWITGRRGSGGAIQYAKDLQNSLNRMEISVQQGLLTLNCMIGALRLSAMLAIAGSVSARQRQGMRGGGSLSAR